MRGTRGTPAVGGEGTRDVAHVVVGTRSPIRVRSQEDSSFLGGALSRSRRPPLAEVAERHPGRLYNQAVEKLSQVLGERGGARSPHSMTQWVTYLQSVLMARAKQSDLTPDRLQELRTLCEVLNLFGQGKVAMAADVLVQRFSLGAAGYGAVRIRTWPRARGRAAQRAGGRRRAQVDLCRDESQSTASKSPSHSRLGQRAGRRPSRSTSSPSPGRRKRRPSRTAAWWRSREEVGQGP